MKGSETGEENDAENWPGRLGNKTAGSADWWTFMTALLNFPELSTLLSTT
jgi:hypothetical protein